MAISFLILMRLERKKIDGNDVYLTIDSNITNVFGNGY